MAHRIEVAELEEGSFVLFFYKAVRVRRVAAPRFEPFDFGPDACASATVQGHL